jgi:NADH:ubiquinone oxidoreductase subunit H
LRVAGWLVAYIALFAIHSWFERWLIARFLNQAWAPILLPGTHFWRRSSRTADRMRGALVGGLLAGGLLASAVIPLAPGVGPLADANAGALYALAATVFLVLASPEHLAQDRSAKVLLTALPLILILLTVTATGGALGAHGEGSLRLDRLIEAQAGWNGLRWIGILQPLGLLLWLSGISFLLRGAGMRPTLAGQVARFTCALLSAALFLGGWQGPFVHRAAWLGLLYTGAKVLCLTFIWSWAAVSLPRRSLSRHIETVWLLHAPLCALNLVVTAIIVAVGSL